MTKIEIKDFILNQGGTISIEQFMNYALYNPQDGYYMQKNPIGAQGDFITAPEISQLFGETIGIWLMLKWQELGQPKKFTIAELGPGRGTMMADIMRITSKVFTECSPDIYLMEISQVLRAQQQQQLSSYHIRWFDQITDLPPQPTIFIANEFFDAIPIQQYIYQNHSWYERHLNHDLYYVLGKQSNFSEGIDIQEGAIIEINMQGQRIFTEIECHARTHGGGGVIIDYGYINKPYTSTLQAVKEHKYHDVFQHIGEIDMTAHVDFSMFKNCHITTQAEFLNTYGIKERAGKLLRQAGHQQAQDIMSALHRLTSNTAMGELFKVASF